MTPYRQADEPEADVLWTAPVARFARGRSTRLFGTIGASLGVTVLAVALGAPALGGIAFAIFLGATAVGAGRTWPFDRRLELRVERIGATERLRVTGTDVALTAPFALAGSSRIDEGGYLVMQLEVRGGDGRRTTIGALVEASEDAASRDDWFDGAPLAADAHAGDFMLDGPRRLISLYGVLASHQGKLGPRTRTQI